jgi:hypothetical protein
LGKVNLTEFLSASPMHTIPSRDQTTSSGLTRAHGGKTPLFAFNTRLKAKPDPAQSPTHFRVRKESAATY